MILDRRWIIYNTTEDDEIAAIALSCHDCHLPGQCLVKRENAFLGVRTC